MTLRSFNRIRHLVNPLLRQFGVELVGIVHGPGLPGQVPEAGLERRLIGFGVRRYRRPL